MKPLEPSDPPAIGPYRLVGRLGQGGMGRVYLGRTPGGRPAAVKVITTQLEHDPAALTRFQREVATLQTVRNAFTAALIDHETSTPPYWLATEYVPGPTLADAVREHGALPVDVCRGLFAALAEALADVHRHGISHRDIKPANVILSVTGPQLIDFGISRSAEQTALTQTGMTLGTPGFTAPEVLTEDGTVGPAGDVFALGATIAMAATGRRPFGEGNAFVVSQRTLTGEIDVSGVPAPLAGLISACCATDPAVRPAPEQIVEQCELELGLIENTGYQRLLRSVPVEISSQDARGRGGLSASVTPDSFEDARAGDGLSVRFASGESGSFEDARAGDGFSARSASGNLGEAGETVSSASGPEGSGAVEGRSEGSGSQRPGEVGSGEIDSGTTDPEPSGGDGSWPGAATAWWVPDASSASAGAPLVTPTAATSSFGPGGFPGAPTVATPSPGADDARSATQVFGGERRSVWLWPVAVGLSMVLLAGAGFAGVYLIRGAGTESTESAADPVSPVTPSPSTETGSGSQPTTSSDKTTLTGPNGTCLSVPDTKANGDLPLVQPCDGSSAQQWTYTTDHALSAEGKCLDLGAEAPGNGRAVQLWDCNATQSQVFETADGDELKNPWSGRCLTTEADRPAAGDYALVWDCSGGNANQVWHLPGS